MFKFLRTLFGIAIEDPASIAHKSPPIDFGAQLLNDAISRNDARLANPGSQLVSREAILDRHEAIAGYEFALQENMHSRMLESSERLQNICDDALIRNLCSLNTGSLLGNRLAAVRLFPLSLCHPMIGKLPATNTVIIISPGEQALDRNEIVGSIARLTQASVAHGWVLRRPQLAARPELLEFAAGGDYIQIETDDFNGVELRALMRELRIARDGSDKIPAPRLIAHKLATVEDYQLCYRSGFDYFHGSFMTRRDNWTAPPSEHNRLHLLEILNLVRGEAEFGLVAEHLKREPVLSFKLLRYLNSSAIGLTRPLATITQALTILGRDKFYRWLSLLLFEFEAAGYRERILTEQALTRGRFLERLAGQGAIPEARDALFLLGLFSLIDLLLGRTIDEILRQAKLPSPVEEALLGRPGPWRDALELAIAVQENDATAASEAAARCSVSELDVSAAAIEALAWAADISTAEATAH